jgi:hypothetical protein
MAAMTHPLWVPCGGAKTMANWNAEQFLPLPESGTQPRRFSACPDPGGGLWQKPGGLTSPRSGERRGAAVESLFRRRQCWEKTQGESGPLEQCEKSKRRILKWRRRQCNRLVSERMRTKQPWRMDLPTGGEKTENRSLGLAWKLRRE